MPTALLSNQKLRVLAKGTGRVPNYEHQLAGRNSAHGWKCVPLGPEFTDADARQSPAPVIGRHAAFVKSVGVVIELPDTVEYRRHLRDGDLWAADPETAALVGAKFDPDYGNEHTDEAVVAHEDNLKALYDAVNASPSMVKEPHMRLKFENSDRYKAVKAKAAEKAPLPAVGAKVGS
jgi:hypothetical protein